MPAVDRVVTGRIFMRRIDGQVVGHEPGLVIEVWNELHWKASGAQSNIDCLMNPGTLFGIGNETTLFLGKVDAAWVGRVGVAVVNIGGGGYELQFYAEGEWGRHSQDGSKK